MFHKLKELSSKVHRIIYWAPVIWKDKWWDHTFLLTILEKKLRYDAKNYSKNGHFENCNRYSKQMNIAAELCSRLQKENYTTPWDKEEKEHSDAFWKHMKETKITKTGGRVLYSSEGFFEDKKLQYAARFARKHREDMANQDLKFLCRILTKHLFTWWD